MLETKINLLESQYSYTGVLILRCSVSYCIKLGLDFFVVFAFFQVNELKKYKTGN